MKRLVHISALMALMPVVALAQTKPAPEYFVTALVATSTAEAIALSCPELSVNPVNAVKASEDLLTRLETDGFDTNDPASGMDDATPALVAAQTAFLEKHKLEGAGVEAVCAAGRAEIAESTEIGNLLTEVAQ